MRQTSDPVICYQVVGRNPGTGPVLALCTGGPADLAVAASGAAWAAGTRSLVIAITVVTGTGFSLNPLLHQVRARRQDCDSVTIINRIVPALTAAGVAWLRTIVAVPAGAGPASVPLGTIRRLVDRFAAVAVVTATALHDPTGRLIPLTPRAATVAIIAATAHQPPPAATTSATTSNRAHENEA
ncbi:hypothetical protein [Nonomuraea jabiensis]|uniref:hypothetical protein n=1 Tax=Nonomuraea jabiensis TaxID=882448 RepID=UPI003D73A9B3